VWCSQDVGENWAIYIFLSSDSGHAGGGSVNMTVNNFSDQQSKDMWLKYRNHSALHVKIHYVRFWLKSLLGFPDPRI
jgi:hypothetical protein